MPIEINRVMEIAKPFSLRTAEEMRMSTDPKVVWGEHTAALALLLATMIEQLDPEEEADARRTFLQAVDAFLHSLRASPDRPSARKP